MLLWYSRLRFSGVGNRTRLPPLGSATRPVANATNALSRRYAFRSRKSSDPLSQSDPEDGFSLVCAIPGAPEESDGRNSDLQPPPYSRALSPLGNRRAAR